MFEEDSDAESLDGTFDFCGAIEKLEAEENHSHV